MVDNAMANQANMNLNPFDDTVNIQNPFDAVDGNTGSSQPGGSFDMFGQPPQQQNLGAGFDFTNPSGPPQQNNNVSSSNDISNLLGFD